MDTLTLTEKTYLLELAAIAEYKEQIKILIKLGLDINMKDEFGYTILMRTVNPVIIKALIELGADPNIQDQNGNTALHHAKSSFQIITLLKYGADPCIANNEGWKPFFDQDFHEKSILKICMEAGADMFSINEDGKGLLHFVETPDVRRWLIEEVGLEEE